MAKLYKSLLSAYSSLLYRYKPIRMVLLCLVLLVAIPHAALAQPMAGTYTVCPSGCDFASIASAITALRTKGVSAAVTIDIQAGTYQESIRFAATVPGSAANKIVTIKGQGRNTLLQLNSDSGVLKLTQLSHIAIKDMVLENTRTTAESKTIQLVSVYQAAISNCEVRNKSLHSRSWCLVSSESENLTIDNNKFIGGSTGIQIAGGNLLGSNRIMQNHVVRYGLCGVLHGGLKNDWFIGNVVDSALSDTSIGVHFTNTTGGGFRIENNYITGYNNKVAFLLEAGGNSQYDNYLINNHIGSLISSNPGKMQFAMDINNNNGGKGILHIWHNTVAAGKTTCLGALRLSFGYQLGISIRNNNFYTAGGKGVIWAKYISAGQDIDYNCYWNNQDSNKVACLIGKDTQSLNLKQWRSYAAEFGLPSKNDVAVKCQFKGSNDLHFGTAFVPFGRPLLGVSLDIDGDLRCVHFPTMGADESWVGKGVATANFSVPAIVYRGSHVLFKNADPPGVPRIFKWYVDGVLQFEGPDFETTKLTSASHDITLESIGCTDTSRITKSITTILPNFPPTTNFISSGAKVYEYQEWTIKDSSTNGPTHWQWVISPATVMEGSYNVPTFIISSGSLTQHKATLYFTTPGKYQVCLRASNGVGSGAQVCRTQYVEVLPYYQKVDMESTEKVSFKRGRLYDNGGPNRPYTKVNSMKRMLINACSDTIFFKVKSFDMHCNQDYLRVYAGEDDRGTLLNECPGGWTGNSTNCTACAPDTSKIYKAVGALYIEQYTKVLSGEYAGYEIEWWTSAKSIDKPVAKIESNDTICLGNFTPFYNRSTGANTTYLWDFDGDLSSWEANSTTQVSWPFLEEGNYVVTLVAENCAGIDTFRKLVTVIWSSKPQATFVVDNAQPRVGEKVLLKATGEQCIDFHYWTITKDKGAGTATFMDGTSAADATTAVSFSDTGLYTVKLWVMNADGEDSLRKTGFIYVKPAMCTPSVTTLSSTIVISRVKLHTLDHTSPAGTGAYSDYRGNASHTTSLLVGQKYGVTVSRTSNTGTVRRSVFIDWNGDGDFDDAGELAANEVPSSSLSWSSTITVPANATLGATTMRVAINQGAYTNKPCGKNEFGEYEDYRIQIKDDVQAPSITLKGLDTVRIEQGRQYIEAGYTAMDNKDGNISSKVAVLSIPTFSNMDTGTYIFTYGVSDLAGNRAGLKLRIVIVEPDTTKPSLRLGGPEKIIVNAGNIIYPPVILEANDLVDGNMISKVQINPHPITISNRKVDSTKIIYRLVDQAGNDTVLVRWIIVIDTTGPIITLRDSDEVFHAVHKPYSDSGVLITDNSSDSLYLHTTGLSINSNFNPNKIGVFYIKYTARDEQGNVSKEVTRRVNVIDTIAPVAFLTNASVDTIQVFSTFPPFKLEDATATDNYNTPQELAHTFRTEIPTLFPDGVARKLGTYRVEHIFTDESGNSDSASKFYVVVDNEAPVVKLVGDAAVTLCRWKPYADLGYTATDNYYSAAGLREDREGTFFPRMTDTPGVYNLRYMITDSSGNVGYSPYRIITVVDTRAEMPDGSLCNVVDGVGLAQDFDVMSKLVTVYPNPNTGRFQVKVDLPAGERVTMVVIDAMGRQVGTVNNSKSITRNTYELDMTGASAGVYLLQVTGSNYSFTKRIAIQK